MRILYADVGDVDCEPASAMSGEEGNGWEGGVCLMYEPLHQPLWKEKNILGLKRLGRCMYYRR